MYIGSTGPKGLHHLVYEIVDNSIDEALAGYCTQINVEILPGNIIRVSDNGRGIPVGIHSKEGISAATVVYTILHAGGKFGGGGYKVAGGLHGVGASVVNALSEWLELTVKDGTHVYFQRFERGHYDELLKIIGDTTETGTSVMFKADPEIFEETTEYDFEILLKRLREQAFLNAGIKIVFTDSRNDEAVTETLYYEGGIKQFVEHIHNTRGLEPLTPEVIYISGIQGDSSAEIAMQYNDSYNEVILSFANNIHTIDGGSHETGFKNALTKVINEYGKKFGLLKDGDKLIGEDVREGLTAIVSVKLTDCEFEGQTKGRLGNPEVRPFVENMVMEKLMCYLEENPAQARAIFDKSLAAQRAREAAKKPVKPLAENQLWNRPRSPESLPTALRRILNLLRFTSSREIQREVPQSRDVTEDIRQYFLFGERCLTLKRHVSTRFTEMKSLCLLLPLLGPLSARISTFQSFVTEKSL